MASAAADAAADAPLAPLEPALAALVAASEQAALTLLVGNCGAARSMDGQPWTATLTSAAPQLTVFWAPVPGSSNNRFKGVCELPYAPALVWDCLHDNPRRHHWDRNISRVASLPLAAGPRITPASAPVRACIVHSQTRNVGIISGRDFVDLPVFLALEAAGAPAGPDAWVAPPGTLVSGGAGVEDARFPEQKGFVRGWNSPGSGWVLEPLPQGGSGALHTRVHYLIHTDLKGWIPCALINASLAVRWPAGRVAAARCPRRARFCSSFAEPAHSHSDKD